MPDLTFLFIVEGPRLEAQAILLAATLRQHHPQAGIIGYRPETAPEPPAALTGLFAHLGAELRTLPIPPRFWRGPYPHGNKILALAEPRDTDTSIFLDTDMMMAAPLTPDDLPGAMEISVIPEGILSWGKDVTRWDRVYAHFGLTTPPERIRLLRGARRPSPPYFNAGFIAQREADRVDGLTFGALWRDTARIIDHEVGVGSKRPWLDQIALPVTLRRFGFAHRILDEAANFSVSNGRRLPDPFAPKIIHYHRARFLRAWPDADARITQVLATAPAPLRAGLDDMLAGSGFTGPIPEDE